jgi:hypothetical protein
MLNYIEYLDIPIQLAITIVASFLVMQDIGELLEFKGKIVPEFLKIRKYFSRKKKEKEEITKAILEVKSFLQDKENVEKILSDVKVFLKDKEEIEKMLSDVKIILQDFDSHYSSDNITKRDCWMKWVNDKAEVYDNSICEIGKISENLTNVIQALKDCTKMTEEMFVQSSRDRIIDFASKAGKTDAFVSKEEFHRIFKVYEKYENFLEEHNMTNGEVDVAYKIIEEAYEDRIKNRSFIEDIRGYNI